MERQNTKLGRVIVNKRYQSEVKKAAKCIKGYPQTKITKSNYYLNRWYNILLYRNTGILEKKRRYFKGNKIQLLKALRECTTLETEDIEQEFYLCTLNRGSQILFKEGFNETFFYLLSNIHIAKFILVDNELTNPVKKDLEYIPFVNLKSSNIDDILSCQNPDKDIDYKIFLSKLTQYERNIVYLLYEEELPDVMIYNMLGINKKMYFRYLKVIKEKIWRFYATE